MRKLTGYNHQSKDWGVQPCTDNQKRCFNCNATGHFAKNLGRGAPVESQGKNNSSKSSKPNSGSIRYRTRTDFC